MNKEKIKNIFLDSWHPFVWIASLIFLVYSATLFFNVVYLDDNVLVVNQYEFNRDLSNIPEAFKEDIFRTPHDGGTFYRPVERITFMIDAQFGQGAIIFMSHLSNMILHILAICLFYLFLLKIKIRKEIAFIFTVIFSIHPLTAQTVAFISGRNDSLLAIFVFPSLIFFLNYLDNKKRMDLVFHLLFLALALFTKETAAVLPGICFIYLSIFVGWKKISEDLKKYLYLGGCWVVLVSFWLLVRGLVLNNLVGNAKYNIFLSVYKNLPSLIPAVGKVFLPFDLSVFPILADMNFWYGIISIFMLITWYILSEKRNYQYILFGFSWFIIFILLTLLKPLGTIPEFSENRIYIPMFGFAFVILGLGKIKFPIIIREKINNENLLKIILSICLILVIVLSSITIYRNKYYKNKTNFWLNATETSPSFAFNHNNLGAMYFLDGKMDAAEKEFKKAIELNPIEPMAHNNLGLVYVRQNKIDEAEELYKKELEINPNYDNAYFNYGLLLFEQKKYREAEENFQKTLSINPNYSDAINALAILYYTEGNFKDAKIYAKAAYQRGIELPQELINLFR